MKYLIILLTSSILLQSCKDRKLPSTATKQKTEKEISSKSYPKQIQAVFDAHGGIDTWNDMQRLTFEIPKGDLREVHTVDLKTRKTSIKTQNYTLAYDGKGTWLEQDSVAFNPDRARFYHNLMFYFYAMPFVLGDDGIIYEEVAPLQKNDIVYPGTKISFKAGIGDAPDDNYILYRDPKTNEMAWLAYTVTYGKEGPSERYSFIKYGKWQELNGLKLPNELQWFTVVDGKPTEMRNAMTFNKVSVTKEKPNAELFIKPEGTNYINE